MGTFGGAVRFFGIGGAPARAGSRGLPQRGGLPLRHRLRPDRNRPAPGGGAALQDRTEVDRSRALEGVELRIADAEGRIVHRNRR